MTFVVARAAPTFRASSALCVKYAAWLFFSWIALASSPSAIAAAAPTHYWFQPSLKVNADPLCDGLLADARRVFESEAPWDDYGQNTVDRFSSLKQIRVPTDSEEVPDPTVEVIPESYGDLAVTLPDGTRVYVFQRTFRGCGGACETAASLISEAADAVPLGYIDGRTSDPAISSTPPIAGEWMLHRSNAGGLFTTGVVDGNLHVYKAHRPAQWSMACEILLAPSDIRERTGKRLRDALRSIDALDATTRVMAGEEGNCGSAHTNSRWGIARTEALQQALYRPWALTSAEDISRNSFGNYERIEPDLFRWSLGGLHEHRAFARYRKQLQATTNHLAQFYVEAFRLTPHHAETMADQSLKNAIATGFGFYMYAPYSGIAEEALRRAILERRPIEEIRAIEFDPATIDRQDVDSILNVAITYPEALGYLLSRGLRVDIVNGFGKTPLMYAAQHDQIESARLLLAAGANVTAATVMPFNTCAHSLEAINVTVLHYAARYASPALIHLLLAHGATASAEVLDTDSHSPIYWTRLNAKLNVGERRAIEDALQAAPK